MRIFIPKNIEWGLFNMNIQLWPFNITMIQLFIIAWWSALTLSIWQSLVKHGLDKITALIFVSPIVLLTLFIAFFKISELSLIPFISKLLRTYFFDTPTKRYTIFKEVDPLEVKIHLLKSQDNTKKIEEKDLKLEKEKLEKLKTIL